MQRYKLYNTVQNNLGKFSSFFSFLSEKTFKNFVTIAVFTKENIRNIGISDYLPTNNYFSDKRIYLQNFIQLSTNIPSGYFANMDFDTITTFFCP